ncbi:MAG: hypothetical protein RIS47_650 [Bacteroidota bacterium]|jgi:hypothetical protein
MIVIITNIFLYKLAKFLFDNQQVRKQKFVKMDFLAWAIQGKRRCRKNKCGKSYISSSLYIWHFNMN